MWIGDGGVKDTVVGKGDEREVLIMEAGVLCWAKGRKVVSWRLAVLFKYKLRKRRNAERRMLGM